MSIPSSNSMIIPCFPISQSYASLAFSKFVRSETAHERLDISFSLIGLKRPSSKALLMV
jgi:hypothetical protein